MTLGGHQKVDELAEHVRADRLALVSAGLHGVVGVDAEMVRPKPYHALDKADLGPYGAVVVGLRLTEEILLHRRFGLRLPGCGLRLHGFWIVTLGIRRLFHTGAFARRVLHHRIVGSELRRFLLCRFLCSLLAPGLELSLRRTRGDEIRCCAARRTAADEPGIGNRAGVRLVELDKERGSGIGCDRRDGTGARSKAESMQRERCFPRV